jgi:hypothetical protein
MSALLLDTHIWLWYAEGITDRLKPASIKKLDDARKEDGLLVSAISVWEVGVLHARGGIQVSAPLRDWVEKALSPPGIDLLALDGGLSRWVWIREFSAPIGSADLVGVVRVPIVSAYALPGRSASAPRLCRVLVRALPIAATNRCVQGHQPS